MARKYTATYNPYTFEELMKPVDRYTAAYEKLEDQLDDLAVQSAILNKLDPVLDKEAYDLNKAHQDALLSASGEMSSSGLNPTLRATINGLRMDQRAKLDPLITAYKEREALIKEQRSKGDNYIFSKDYANTPLTEMLTGTNTYNAYNLEDALKEGMASGKAISSRIYSDPTLARELKDQYFRMANGIDVDGRTVDQLFNDYPELQQDFNNWYSSQFEGTPAYNDADLKRAQDRYMSGVLRGIVYSEDYKTNQDHKTPHQRFEEGMATQRLAMEKDKTYGMVINDSGDRGKDAGNGVVLITPANSNSASGYGAPYWAKKDANGNITRISDDEASATISKGTYMGKDVDGNPQYNNGKGIVTYDKNDPQKIKSFQTFKDASEGNGSPSSYGVTELDGSSNISSIGDLGTFKDFNFDSHYDNNNFKYETDIDHGRGSVTEAINKGYKPVAMETLSPEIREGIVDQLKKSKGKLQLSDLVVLEDQPHHTTRPGAGQSGDNHYIVTLKPAVYDQIYGRGSSPLWQLYGGTIGGSSTPIPPADLNAELQRITDSLENAAANRYGGKP